MTADKTNLDQQVAAERSDVHQVNVSSLSTTSANVGSFSAGGLVNGAQGLPVAGYRKQQPQWALDLVNANKIEEEKALRNLDFHASRGTELDQRAVAVARTKIQEAYMWLNRAVFQPQRLEGDL